MSKRSKGWAELTLGSFSTAGILKAAKVAIVKCSRCGKKREWVDLERASVSESLHSQRQCTDKRTVEAVLDLSTAVSSDSPKQEKKRGTNTRTASRL